MDAITVQYMHAYVIKYVHGLTLQVQSVDFDDCEGLGAVQLAGGLQPAQELCKMCQQ